MSTTSVDGRPTDTGAALFHDALEAVSETARLKLPESLQSRLAAAVVLVHQSKVWPEEDGHTFQVESRSTPGRWYGCNGACPCDDAHYQAPNGLCAHRIAVGLWRKTCQRLEEEEERYEVTTLEPEPAAPVGIDPRYIVTISGKHFVLYAGLLALAQARGLVRLSATWTFNDVDTSLAQAVAVFADGRRFEESGDSSPANVGKKVALHWRRISLTRAKARCLRDALTISECAFEELGEEG
jgi:hypothetical protein